MKGIRMHHDTSAVTVNIALRLGALGVGRWPAADPANPADPVILQKSSSSNHQSHQPHQSHQSHLLPATKALLSRRATTRAEARSSRGWARLRTYQRGRASCTRATFGIRSVLTDSPAFASLPAAQLRRRREGRRTLGSGTDGRKDAGTDAAPHRDRIFLALQRGWLTLTPTPTPTPTLSPALGPTLSP